MTCSTAPVLKLTALLLVPLAWESVLGEDTTEKRCMNKPAKSPNP
jgi:hypothetical protein